MMVKELKKLDTDVSKAIERVAAEFNFAKELKNELDKIETDYSDESQVSRTIRKGLETLRWVEKAERQAERYETKVQKDLNQLAKLLPVRSRARSQEYLKKLAVAHAQTLKIASTFGGSLRKKLKDLGAHEKLMSQLARNYKDSDKTLSLLKKVTDEVSNLIIWVESTQAILKEIRGFEQELEKQAA